MYWVYYLSTYFPSRFQIYLQYKEHTAENLDFYFWFITYRNQFNALSEEEKAKSPSPKERPSPGLFVPKIILMIMKKNFKKRAQESRSPFSSGS
jgi:hypothetical protein